MPYGAATKPSRIGPIPSPRSIAALAVPDATPRSFGAALAKIAEKNAGVLKLTPTARTAMPTNAPDGSGQSAASTRPAPIVARAAAPSGKDGRRSGTRANAIRHATIKGALGSLEPGAGLVLVAPHDPVPLLQQVHAEAPGRYAVDYLETGPDAWRLAFVRR